MAVLAAVAAIGSIVSETSLASGYQDGFVAAAVIALALAAIALIAVPSVKPEGVAQAMAH